MAGNSVLPWITVNGLMDDDYRYKVVQIALQHWPQATGDFRQLADRFLSVITVPGFRTIKKAPVHVALPHVVRAFQKRQPVASVIICLWAESQKSIINYLKGKVQEEGIKFQDEWTWENALPGYYEYEAIPIFSQAAQMLIEGKEKLEHDNIMLAILWLSRAIIEPEKVEHLESCKNPVENVEDRPEEQVEAIDALDSDADGENGGANKPLETTLPIEFRCIEETSITTPDGLPVNPLNSVSFTQLDLRQEDLGGILQLWDIKVRTINQAQASAECIARDLNSEISEGQAERSKLTIIKLQNCIDEWVKRLGVLDKFSNSALERIRQEYDLRPDLEKPELVSTGLANLDTHWTRSVLDSGRDAIVFIQDYERTKKEQGVKLDMLREEIAKTQQSLLIWENNSSENIVSLNGVDETDELTLHELNKMVYNTELQLQSLTTKHTQFRNLCISRIQSTVSKLIELGVNGAGIPLIFNDKGISELATEELVTWLDKDLQTFEEFLHTNLIELIAKTQLAKTSALAASLKQQWDEEVLVKLHQQLAAEKREAEAFLLELSAVKAHPRNMPNIYSKEVVKNSLNGLEQFSSKTKPFELLGWIAPSLLTGFKSETLSIQAAICLVSLAANLRAGHLQPNGYLWQISSTWPMPDMLNWEKLWQDVLLEEQVKIFSDQKEDIMQSEVVAKRKEAESILARDGAHFIRLNSLQSLRHRQLLTNKLLPVFVEILHQLNRLETSLTQSTSDRLPALISKLQTSINKVQQDLDEAAIVKKYEAGVYEDGIEETEPFHRKISLRILVDCANSIREYGGALYVYWELRDTRSRGLNSSDLLDELSKLPELPTIGLAAFDHIVQYRFSDRVDWNEETANRLSMKHIIREILTQPVCALNLPRLVSGLVNHYLDWDSILNEVLNDIAEPLNPEKAATYLVDAQAPNQALLVVQHLPLDKQKQAQEMRSDFERRMSALLPELLQLEGDMEVVNSWRDVGRWSYMLEKISDDISLHRALLENRQRELVEKSLEFRQRINKLDEDLFKTKTDLPPASYNLISQGLEVARRASEVHDMFEFVKEFLQEITYRFGHRSWGQEELQEAVWDLEKAASRISEAPLIHLTAEQVLKHLESGQLEELDISNDQLSESEINTRSDLLHSWLSLKEHKGLLTKDIHQVGIDAIQNLFRYFAQMMKMKRFRTVDGKEMAFDQPLVYEYWQLQYPRTAALDNPCILLALPGTPPSLLDLKTLQEFIEDKEFLGDYFVFLFVPGSDEKTHNRFSGVDFDGKGLVYIDEAALLHMILAESENMNPVGRLRPLMLNSIHANTDIFTVNQTVDDRTAIFLGRDRLIERIVRSGGNHPIYGGRRIGKSSILKAVEEKLLKKNVKVVFYTLEGDKDLTDDAVAWHLAEEIGFHTTAFDTEGFKRGLMLYMDNHPSQNLVIMLDEVDRYIQVNRERHTLIEALRAASDRYGNRFRIIIAGFMELFDCLSGRGPYTQTSDPWRRMLDNDGPLGNLKSIDAEDIVKEGFQSILGWKLENRAIPQLVVERTGGHPAFVQQFCRKLLEKGRKRGDQLVWVGDVDDVFFDNDPKNSFIAYVRETLEMNLDVVSRYLVVMLAARPQESIGFTWDEIQEIGKASDPPIPVERLKRSLELLSVTSVVREVVKNSVYEYTVPDYPNILQRLGDTAHLQNLEDNLKIELEAGNDGNQ